MKRWLFNVMAALSVLAFFALGAIWMRSHHRSDVFSRLYSSLNDPQKSYLDQVSIEIGRLRIERMHVPAPVYRNRFNHASSLAIPSFDERVSNGREWHGWGFQIAIIDASNARRIFILIPIRFLMLLTLPLPLLWLRQRSKHRSQIQGFAVLPTDKPA